VAALRGPIHGAVAGWGVALVVYALYRTFWPLSYYEDSRSSLLALLAELGLTLTVVAATGYWNSPFVFTIISAVIAAGFARGFGFALELAAACALAVSIPYWLLASSARTARLQDSAQWSAELVLVALVAGYARRLFGEAEVRHSLALDRISRLAEANALLSSLHRVAQSLPASLDLNEILGSTVNRLHELVEFDTAAVLLCDEAGPTWTAAITDGVRLDRDLDEARLPEPVRAATSTTHPQTVPNLANVARGGLGPLSRSGLYAPLWARGRLIGVVALEHHASAQFGHHETRVLDGFLEPAALAIDNARWFARLRTVGADEERTRIARELHDRIGQSLAYVAFELDRILRRSQQQLVHDDLMQLRQDVRSVVGEVRETLYDMRTDVTEGRDLASTLDTFLRRVRERTGLEVTLRHDEEERLPLPQERELWRIAQEAITNVERHAGATRVSVQWTCDDERALLVVADDGRGFPPGKAGRMDSYGIIGMRERADAIGALLEFDSAEGRGTTVRCLLDRR